MSNLQLWLPRYGPRPRHRITSEGNSILCGGFGDTEEGSNLRLRNPALQDRSPSFVAAIRRNVGERMLSLFE